MSPTQAAVAHWNELSLPAQALPAPAPAARRPGLDVTATMSDLHARYGSDLLRFCRWMLHESEDAEDALQDTWIRAMSALGDGSVRITALRPWLYAIARNVCLDRLRERKRASLQDLDEESTGETPGADEVVALRHEAGAALALVGALSERQRSALLMRELAGMSVPEIATALDLTPERAAWAIGDARRALEEARSGGSMACEDARARLASGHRGRTLRAHLGGCTGCCAHDRRLRAGRVLAPALVPFMWLRNLTLSFLAPPAAVATIAAALVISAAPPVELPNSADLPAASVAASPAPAAATSDSRVRVPRSSGGGATGRSVRPVLSTRRSTSTARAEQLAPPVSTAAVAASQIATPVPADPPLKRVVAAVAAPVKSTVAGVAEAARSLPVAPAVLEQVEAAADARLAQLAP